MGAPAITRSCRKFFVFWAGSFRNLFAADVLCAPFSLPLVGETNLCECIVVGKNILRHSRGRTPFTRLRLVAPFHRLVVVVNQFDDIIANQSKVAMKNERNWERFLGFVALL